MISDVFRPPFLTLKECLENWEKKSGDKPAIEYIDVENSRHNWSCNFEQFNVLVGKTRYYLVLNGIKKGDAIAFAYENSPEVILLSWAAWTMGVKIVPLDTKRDDLEMMRYKTSLARVKILFSKGKIELGPGAKSIVLSMKDLEDIQTNGVSDQRQVELTAEALVLFTSGTTAKPKGVLLTQENLMANADGIADWLKIAQNDKFMITLPLHHINSTTMCLATFIRGGTVALTSRYSNSGFWKIAAQSGATLTSVVPTIIHDQLEQIATGRTRRYIPRNDEFKLKLTRIQLGSAPVVAAEAENFVKLTQIPLIQGYGQTETALRSTGVSWNQEQPLGQSYWKNLRSNTIGSEMKWTIVTVIKEDGLEAKESEEGEICVKGPVIMKEYINNPEETKKAFEFGWFHSGDSGYWKMNGSEKQFFIKGRMKEIIIKAGTNVSPLFVEKAVLKAVPDIDQVYVIGVPDERDGEEIGAVVVKKEKGKRKKEEGRKIRSLSVFETPKYWFVVSAGDLPMTSTGKVQRIKLKQMFFECYSIAETKNHIFRRLAIEEAGLIEQARQIHNIGWQPLRSSKNEWREELTDKFLIGAINKINGELDGYIRCQKLGKTINADALSVRGKSFNPKFFKNLPRLTVENVETYLKKNIDPLVKFHKRPKAGLKIGAKKLEIIPQARPGDLSALGFGVLMEYPSLKTEKPVMTVNASLGQQLVETALILAKKQNINSVQVLTRPVKLLEWGVNSK